jgi:hypothetical protein
MILDIVEPEKKEIYLGSMRSYPPILLNQFGIYIQV